MQHRQVRQSMHSTPQWKSVGTRDHNRPGNGLRRTSVLIAMWRVIWPGLPPLDGQTLRREDLCQQIAGVVTSERPVHSAMTVLLAGSSSQNRQIWAITESPIYSQRSASRGFNPDALLAGR